MKYPLKKLLRLLIVLALLLPLCISYRHSSAQSGVLIPSTSSKPDPNTLSLQVMNVDVLIDNQHARVKVMQIFDNHSAQVLEGKYLFALPPRCGVGSPSRTVTSPFSSRRSNSLGKRAILRRSAPQDDIAGTGYLSTNP